MFMIAKPFHGEISRLGGLSRSDRKVAAVKQNLEKAKAPLLAKRADRAAKDLNCGGPPPLAGNGWLV